MFEGVSVTPNIEKHAGAPLWPLNYKSTHPKYNKIDRLKIFGCDKELKELIKQRGGKFKDGILVDCEMFANPLDDIKVADITCPCDDKILYEQIFEGEQQEEVMAYKTCKHTIYGAAKRQMKAAPAPEPKVADDFVEFAKNKILEDLERNDAGFEHFGYSYQQWYAHLDSKKQRDMDLVAKYYNHEELTDKELRKVEQINYEGICKVELQNTNGKPRMVCSIPLQTKYIMGPITWKLEETFGKYVRGYCGGKNLDEMADMINGYLKQGFTKIVEGDGSAFDNTQDVSLKEIDRWIYRQVMDKVYHIPDPKLFEEVSQSLTKTMDVIYTDKYTKRRKKMFSYTILGSVFSGDCDTTLCNTIRMAMYNRYVNEKYGWKWGEDYVCFAKGDDFTVMYKPEIKDEDIHKAYYTYFVKASDSPDKADTRVYGLGQVLKMLDIGGPEIIKFCSLRAWFKNDDEIILTRNPEKFYTLNKYSRKTKTYNYKQYIQYLMDQAVALRVSNQGILIFEEMAKAYMLKAKIIAKYRSFTHKTINDMYQQSVEQYKIVKKQASNYAMAEDGTTRILYNIKYKDRKLVHKIEKQYWETQKKYMLMRNEKLTPEELKLINQQIEKEFEHKELLSALGLNKSNE